MPKVSDVIFAAAGTPSYRLEGLLHHPEPRAGDPGSCLLLPAHPLFGGSMETWLLGRVAERLVADGWTVLRINFRGVGASEGCSSDGSGEVWDALGALAFLDQVAPALDPANPRRRAVVGWSFGALVGMLLAEHDVRVTDWVGIGPPTRSLRAIPLADPPYETLRQWGARRCVIVGEHDELYPPRTVAVLHPDLVHVVPDADHFMADRDEEVASAVARALARPFDDE
jgi:alpha/beta superfamily hydrolase